MNSDWRVVLIMSSHDAWIFKFVCSSITPDGPRPMRNEHEIKDESAGGIAWNVNIWVPLRKDKKIDESCSRLPWPFKAARSRQLQGRAREDCRQQTYKHTHTQACSTYTTAHRAALGRQVGDFGNPTWSLRCYEPANREVLPAAHWRPAPAGGRWERRPAGMVATNGIRR